MDATIIPQISKKYFIAKCLCKDSKRCGQTSRSFQDLKDLRGSFVQFPMINGSQRFYLQNAIKTKKAARFSFYLKVPNPSEISDGNGNAALMVDRRNRKKNAQEDTNCDNRKGVMRKRVFVALHHFHPRMIDHKYGIARVDCNGTRFKLPDLVPISKLESSGLMEYYSPNDRYDHHKSLIVPNYALSKSEEDLSQIYLRKQRVPSQNSIRSLNSCVPLLKRSLEDERSILNQSAKRLKSCYNRGNTTDMRMELNFINDCQRNTCGSLEKNHSRTHVLSTPRLNLLQSHYIDTFPPKEKLAVIVNALIAESLSDADYMTAIQKQMLNIHKAYLLTLSQSQCARIKYLM